MGYNANIFYVYTHETNSTVVSDNVGPTCMPEAGRNAIITICCCVSRRNFNVGGLC